MDISDYYSQSFESFKGNPKIMVPQLVGIILQYLLIGIIFLALLLLFFGPNLLNVLSNLITNGTMPNVNPPAIDTGLMFLVFISLILIMALLIGLITSFVSAATIGMVKKIIKEGSSNLDFAWKCGRKYFLKIFLASLIIGIIFFVLFIPLLLGLILTNAVLAIIGAIILLFLGIILFLGVMVVGQSIVVGEKAVIEAVRESFHLFWNNKLTIFLVGVINFIISLILSLALGFILGLIPVVGSTLSSIIISLLLTPFFTLVTTYLYLDLKGEETV